MRQIGVIPGEDAARHFGDYLLAMNIPNQIEQSAEGQWDVWVENDDHIEQAAREIQAFMANPADARYSSAASTANRVRADKVKREQKWRKHFVDVRTDWAQAKRGYAPLTWTLIALCVLVFLFAFNRKPGEGVENSLLIAPVEIIHTPSGDMIAWNRLEAIHHGQIWRLITPIFLHFGILHIVFNMWWLRDLGSMIEAKRGTLFMALLVLVSAILGNLAQYYWMEHHNPPQAPLFGGMSGVVYALFSYIWLKGLIDPGGGLGVSNAIAWLMFGWLAACMLGILGPIANGAHVVGLAVGLVMAYIPHVFRKVLR